MRDTIGAEIRDHEAVNQLTVQVILLERTTVTRKTRA